MSTSKLKLNPDKTEFVFFGSKTRRDKLTACFVVDMLGSLSALFRHLRIWVCGLILNFPCPNIFQISVKVMMLLYLWLLLLLVVGWITAIDCSGVSPSSIYLNYSASKIMQPELYKTPVDAPV